MSEAAITEEVRALYEKYPFPGPYASEKPPQLDGMTSYTYVCYQAFREYRSHQGRRILDAGCGTGETLRRYALNNPGATLVGFDLSQASLDLAAEKLGRVEGVEWHLEQRDLLELAPPKEPFDLVSCTGVLHHLADPLKGLRNLVPYLKRDGIFAIYLYSAYARREIEMAAEIIRMLCGPQESMDKRIDVARRFFRGLPAGHFLLDQAKFETDVRDWIERDEHLADMYLHPREINYTFDMVLELLDGAGLEIVRFYDEEAWDLERLLPDEDLRRRTMFMSRRQKYRLADLLHPRPSYIFMARHKAYTPSRTVGDVPLISPVAAWVTRRPAVARPSIPPDTMIEVLGFAHRSYRLDGDAVEALALCDGARTVDEVADARAAATGADVATARKINRTLFTTLEKQGIVLMKPKEASPGTGI